MSEEGLHGDGWSVDQDWGISFEYRTKQLMCCQTADQLAEKLEDLARAATEAATALKAAKGSEAPVVLVHEEGWLPCGNCGSIEALEVDGDCGVICNATRGGCGTTGKWVPGDYATEAEFEAAAKRVWNERAEVERIAQYVERRWQKRFSHKTVVHTEELQLEFQRAAHAIRMGRHW